MRKTEGITKYQVEWQLLRSGIKGGKTSLDDKLKLTFNYFEACNTYDRWERVVNWLEGLQRGYKAAQDFQSIDRIKQEIDLYSVFDVTKLDSYELDEESELEALKQASIEQLVILWKDLFKTNRGWLVKGYFHKECNAFMDWIYENSDLRDHIKGKFTLEYLKELRVDCGFKENTHKFFF